MANEVLDWERDMSEPYTGGCACGAIRYAISAVPIAMNDCQCRDCQPGEEHGPAPKQMERAQEFRDQRRPDAESDARAKKEIPQEIS